MRADEEVWKRRDAFVREISQGMNDTVRALRKEKGFFFTEKFSIPDGFRLLRDKIIEYNKFPVGGGGPDNQFERDNNKEKCLEEIVQLIRLRSRISLTHDDQEKIDKATVSNKHRDDSTQKFYDKLSGMTRDQSKNLDLNEDAICVNRAVGSSYGAELVGTKWKR